LLTESIHDRHDDDKRCDPEHYPKQGEPSDDGNKPFLTPGAQIPESHQTFKSAKHQLKPKSVEKRLGGELFALTAFSILEFDDAFFKPLRPNNDLIGNAG